MKWLPFLILGLIFSVPVATATEWPNGAKAAVVLTYDDALESQLEHAVPQLDAVGLKGTFFLSGIKQGDIPRWRAVAAEGHELANHTIFHACASATFPADPRYTAETYTPPSMLREIEQQNVLLTALDGRNQHGFATPCGQSTAGGIDYLEALRKANLVTYVRGVVATPADLRANVSTMDPMHIPARGFPTGVTSGPLIDFAKEAEQGRGMAVFLFHGVGGDYLQVSSASHQQLIDWLVSHRSEVWVTTLQNALTWAKAHP